MKFYRQIRENAIEDKKVRNYFKYAIGEIILIVIGILIAMYINNWNTKRIEKSVEISSYQNIKRQINDDKNAIYVIMDINNSAYKQYEYAVQIIEENDRTRIDTLAKMALNLYLYSDFDRSSNIYQNLINSGESKLLKNRDVIEKIQKLEETYILMNRIENTHFELILSGIYSDLQESIKISDSTVRKPEKLFGVDFQNHFNLVIWMCTQKDAIYKRAINEIDTITALIDKEIKKAS